MWSSQYLSRLDFRLFPVLIALMTMSLLILSAQSLPAAADGVTEELFFSPIVKTQLRWLIIGSVLFLFFAGCDYNKLREWTWILYALMLLSLVGLYFTDSIQHVHRWYRLPLIGVSIQPSEFAKLVVVISLSWFLERRRSQARNWGTAALSLLIIAIPFLLILKQPDLGTALVLFPIALGIFYFGDIHPLVIKVMAWMGAVALIFVALIFLNILPHEQVRPYATLLLKDYQFERLAPSSHHQKASATAIAIGGIFGTGWRKSEFSGGGWLPAPYTDSVFPAFGEEFGFVGLVTMLALFYTLLYFSFQVTAVAKDHFGRLLAAGVSVYLAMHVLINVGMMCGFLPITGVPLILVTYGGSSILSTMAAFGILQSIYSRRFMF